MGEYINIEEPITVRQMMNNVSGLRDQWELLFMRSITINDPEVVSKSYPHYWDDLRRAGFQITERP